MLSLVIVICFFLFSAPLFAIGWKSYLALAGVPALILAYIWFFGGRAELESPNADAGTYISFAIYFLVCTLFACTAAGRLITLSLHTWKGWPRYKTFAFEMLPFVLPIAWSIQTDREMKAAQRPPPQACVADGIAVSLGSQSTRLPLTPQLYLHLREDYAVAHYDRRLRLSDPRHQRLACELSENGVKPLKLTALEISSTTQPGDDCPQELSNWDDEYCRLDKWERRTFVPRTLSFETADDNVNDWFGRKVTSHGLYVEARENDGINAIHAKRANRQGITPRKSEFILADQRTTPSGDPLTVACLPFGDEEGRYRCEVRYEIREDLYVNYDFALLKGDIASVLGEYDQTAHRVADNLWPPS